MFGIISIVHKSKLILRAGIRKIFFRFSGELGSAVVEAVMTIPIFLAAVCTLLAIGQMLFARVQIWHCLSQTADCMVQVKEISEEDSPLDIALVYTQFHSMMTNNRLCEICISGGTKGIILTQNTQDNRLDLTASYYLKIPVPYFSRLGFWEQKTIHRRLFTGYIAHDGEGEQTDPTVYVAQYGQVYHNIMTCSKICIKIADPSMVKSLLESRKYRACERCMKTNLEESNYLQIYVTASGDACHSTLSCSGLKRTIRAIKLSEAGGLRACKVCGAP